MISYLYNNENIEKSGYLELKVCANGGSSKFTN